MGKTKVIVSGVVWTIIQNIVNILYGIISVPFLINYFGKEEYGLIGLALSVNVYIQLLDMGMTNSNVRFFSEYLAKGDNEKIQKLFSLTNLFYTVIGLFNSVVLVVLSFFVDIIFKVTPEQTITLRNLLWILALNSTFSWMSVCFDQLLRANELIDWIKKRFTFLKIMQFAILWATILLHFSIETYFFCYIFMATIILPLTIIKVKKILPGLIFSWRFDRTIFHAIFPYALSIFSFSIFHYMAFNFRPLFLGSMSGPSAVAEFSVMNTVAMVVTVISGSFMQVLLPIVTKMAVKQEEQAIQRMMFTGTKYVTILLSMIIFILIINIDEVFTLYVGAEYTFLSKWMVIWLLTLLLSHRNVMTALVFTEQKIKSVAVMGAVAMCLALACYVIFIPVFGVGGIVIGFAVHELTHTLFYYIYFLPRKFNINTGRVFFNGVIPVWILFAALGFMVSHFVKYFSDSMIVSVCMNVFCCLIAFLISTWFILFGKRDRDFAMDIISKKI